MLFSFPLLWLNLKSLKWRKSYRNLHAAFLNQTIPQHVALLTHLTKTISRLRSVSPPPRLLCACMLSATVFCLISFSHSPPLQLWQFSNAAFVHSAWKERTRWTRPWRIVIPSPLMQALSICCQTRCCMPKRRRAAESYTELLFV